MEKEEEVDAKYNLTMRSGASSKESFVSVHENFRRNVSCSSEEQSVSICKGASLSTPSVSLKSLRPILIRDLMVGHRHKGQVLFGNLCVEPLKVDVSVHTIMDDDEGSTSRLCVYNVIGNVISDKHLEFLFSKGLKVAIKEPYFEMDQDGALAIRVDNPRDIVRNPSEKGTGFLELIPSTPVSNLLLTDARNARKQGNQAFGIRDWDRAVRLYTEAAKTVLQLGYKSLLQPSYLPDEVRKELLIIFSNRAEARLLLRHYEAAEIDARIALQLDADHSKSLSRRGRSLRGLHRYKEAKWCFQRALTVIARYENLEMNKDFMEKSIKECSTCEQQQKTGVYNIVELLREAKSGRNPVCGEYVGPVTIGSAEDPNLGRAILVTRDVEPGELLMVSRAVAHVTFEYKIESIFKSYHDLVVSQVLPRARSSELFQKQVSSLSLPSHSWEDLSVPSTGLFTSVNKQLEASTAMEDEMVNLLDSDARLQMDPEYVHRVVKRSAIVSDNSIGLWLLPSFINHSSVPNACWMKIGEDVLFVRAARHLRKGEEVTVSYLFEKSTAPSSWRAIGLQIFGFECRCPRCLLEESMKQFIEMLHFSEWIAMFIMWRRANSATVHLELIERSGELIKKLEWGFKNVGSLSNDVRNQQWMRCSFCDVDLQERAMRQRSLVMQDVETLVRAVHQTVGNSEKLLLGMRRLVRLGIMKHQQVEAVFAPMCICLYGKQSSSSLREILDLCLPM